MLSRAAACAAILAACGPAVAAQSPPDHAMDRYFAIWADDARITPATVAGLYAGRVVYYGKPMTAAAVYRDKRAYVARWPVRHYDVVPGSVGKTCDAGESSCRVTAVLRWSRADAVGRHASRGANTITLDLVREGGALKIARESGSPIAAAVCDGVGRDRACGGFR